MIRVGIAGGAGYTAGELLRILLYHPEAKMVFVQSSSNAGNAVTSVHDDLTGVTDLKFTSEFHFDEVDVLFLCMGHGLSENFMETHKLPENLKIIDLSADYRLKRKGNSFVYGLPELNRDVIKGSVKIANPGCFATGIQLALLPLAANGLLNSEIHVNGITGSTGAGQKPSDTTHFSWRNNNVSAYKVFEHQHEAEILQSLKQLQPNFSSGFYFIPVRGNFSRGIFVTAYTNFESSYENAVAVYENYYETHPFVKIVSVNPSLKQVVNTNKVLLYLEKHDDKLVIVSVSDNLVKGASGQAVQNMNLMFGLKEDTGLNLKPVAF